MSKETVSGELAQLNLRVVAHALAERAEERFGPSGKADRLRSLLREVEVLAGANEANQRQVKQGRSLLVLLPVLVLSLLALGVQAILTSGLEVDARPTNISDLMQGADSAVALIIFIAGLLLGSVKLAKAWLNYKFRRELRKIRRLAERINLVQLDKDPERLTRDQSEQTRHSPVTKLTPWELHRYLSYARTALLILGTLAFSYVDVAPDDDAEEVAQGLNGYIMAMKADVRRKWERMVQLRNERPELFRKPAPAKSEVDATSNPTDSNSSASAPPSPALGAE